jgi:hypothetical protein
VNRTQKFYPGWKMTWDQHNAYFWYLKQVYAVLNLTEKAAQEDMRKTIHTRAFGRPVSARDIDHLKMYDDFKAECLAILKPADVAAQVAQANMPLTRLRTGILEKFDSPTILGLLRSARFKKQSLEDLNDMDEEELTQLRNTLCVRTAGEVAVPAGAFQGEDDGDPF